MDMRLSPAAATTIAALTAGLTAAVAVHRRAGRRLASQATAQAEALTPVVALPARDGVVLPFLRPVPATPPAAQPAQPARCGDTGGETKAGARCAARAGTGGRCHHHPMAA